jgi:hypothetical protein
MHGDGGIDQIGAIARAATKLPPPLVSQTIVLAESLIDLVFSAKTFSSPSGDQRRRLRARDVHQRRSGSAVLRELLRVTERVLFVLSAGAGIGFSDRPPAALDLR